METTTISGVEILRTGTFHGIRGGRVTYTTAILDEMADAHAALEASGATAIRVVLGGKAVSIPLNRTTLGHNEMDDEGQIIREAPVVGRLTNLRRKGEKLLADIADVPVKLAGALAHGYPQRSIEGVRLTMSPIVIGKRAYQRAITGLALLGESLPAVKGLADLERVVASSDEPTIELEMPVHLAAADPADVLTELLAALDSWAEAAIPLVAGKTGAPIIRARVRSLKEDVRRIAGAAIQTSEVDMNDETNDVIQNAGPSDPATAMAVIAEILGLPDADPTAIVARVRELAGGGAATDATGTEDAMSQNTSGAESAESVQLRQQVSELLTWKAQTEGATLIAQAESLVDRAIAMGKFAPAQRETLVALAKHDAGAFTQLADGQPASIPLGERGTGKGTSSEPEPTEAELAVALKMGINRDEALVMLRAERAAALAG